MDRPGRSRAQGHDGRGARREDRRDLEERARRMGRGRRPHPPLPRVRGHRDLHAGQQRRAAALDPALVRAAARGQRRGRDARSHLGGGRGPARAGRHRRRPAQEPRAHPAVRDRRRRLEPRPRARPRGPDRRRPEAAVRQGRRVRRRDLLSRQGPARARDGGEQPARLARLRRVARGRGARHPAPAVHARGQAAHLRHLDRAPLRCGAHVRRDAGRQRTRRLDAPPARHGGAARDLLHGRDLRLLPADGHAALEAADADAHETGARLRARHGVRHPEPRRPRLQGPVERRHLVHRSPADGARPRARHRRAPVRAGRQRVRPRRAREADGRHRAARVPDAQRQRRRSRCCSAPAGHSPGCAAR